MKITSESILDCMIALKAVIDSGSDCEMIIQPIDKENPRSLTQNKCIHLWCGRTAEALNDAGLEQRKFFESARSGFDVPWTTPTVKENLYKPVLKAISNKASTTEMNTVEPSKVVEILNRKFCESGVPLPAFPSRNDS